METGERHYFEKEGKQMVGVEIVRSDGSVNEMMSTEYNPFKGGDKERVTKMVEGLIRICLK